MTALITTGQAYLGKSQGWPTEQGLRPTGNGPNRLAWHSEGLGESTADHMNQKLSNKVAVCRSAAEAPENGRSQDRAKMEECKCQQLFDDPSRWWDNRTSKVRYLIATVSNSLAVLQTNRKYPDFVHASTGECLWIDSYFGPKCVPPKPKCLGAAGRGMHYRKGDESGRRSYVGDKKLPSDTKCESRVALSIYEKMQEDGVRPGISIVLAALKECSSFRDLPSGMKIHTYVIETGYELDNFVANTLVDMYAKCGRMVDARRVFDRMPQHSLVSWNAIILGYAQSGEGELAMQLFECMQDEGFTPNARTFVAALKACTSLAAKEDGKQVGEKLVKMAGLEKGIAIHSQVTKSRHELNTFVANTLVDMYVKCGSMVDARLVFDRMPNHTVVSWNAIILGYAQSGEGELAMQLFARMADEGFTPNARTFVAALKACTSLAAKEGGKQVEEKLLKIACLEKGIAIHCQLTKNGHESDIFVANTLVDMYAKCGSMEHASRVFDRMPRHSLVSWNAIILGYAQSGEGELALQLFARMQDEGCVADARTFVAALQACASLAAKEEGTQVEEKLVKIVWLEKGMAIHSEVAKSGLELDIFVANTLVDMYAKCGSMVDARRVFDRMAHHDVVSWTALILGYAQTGEGELAMQLFACMQDEGFTPIARTFVAALKACTSLAAKEDGTPVEKILEKGIAIHSQVVKSGLELDVFVATSLVDMYARCGEGELALQSFARMQDEGCIPNTQTFAAALKACSSLAAKEDGVHVEGKLVKPVSLEKGRFIHCQVAKSAHELDIFVASTLVDMYAKCGSMVDARRVFDRMPHHDVVSWTAIIQGYVLSGEGKLALQLYARMKDEGFTPDAPTFVAALKACGNLAALETGKRIEVEICSAGLQSDAVVAGSLVDFYGKCGSMVDAQQVFDSIATRNLVTWNALIAGYSRQGDTKRVFDLFERMQKERLQANDITFLSVLTVCSHAGLVDKGKEYFQAMCSDYVISPSIEHYGCMVDLLGRANHLDDAVAMVNNMPFKPDWVIWMTVLGACRKWRNVEVGRLAFESILRLDDKLPSAYVLMANTYARAGMWEESAKIQAMRRDKGAWKKKPGQSWWVDSAGMVHKFVAGDTSHPQSEDIQAKLKDVLVKVKEEGYVPDLDSVFRNISDDEKESALCGHSEKLAIGCALINTAPGTPIRIVKNLRVCDDCHKATAVISRIEQRDITCRDASRFHVFKDGKCSCGDFW